MCTTGWKIPFANDVLALNYHVVISLIVAAAAAVLPALIMHMERNDKKKITLIHRDVLFTK